MNECLSETAFIMECLHVSLQVTVGYMTLCRGGALFLKDTPRGCEAEGGNKQ